MLMGGIKNRTSIVVKITILISSVTLLFFAANIIATYSRVSGILSRTAGEGQSKMAELMASAVAAAVNEKAELAGQRYSKGAYKVSIGDVLPDESSGEWKLPVSAAAIDASGKPLDTSTSAFELSVFYKPLKDFRLGKTGHAALVDDRTYLIFAPDARPFSSKFCSYNELQKVINSRTKWFLMDGVYGHQGAVFASSCAVEHPLLSEKGIAWRVFVVRDSGEVFAPLAQLIYRETATGIVLVIFIAFAGLILGSLFVRPVKKLQEGINRIGRGDLDYRVKVDSADEIGRLAVSFNTMVEGLAENTTSTANLNKETAERKKAENKVKLLAGEWQKAFESIKGAMSGSKVEGSAGLLKEADNLVDMARFEADNIVLNIKPIGIKDLIKKILFVFESRIRDKGLDMKCTTPRENMTIEADADRINQVLAILMDNAAKFTSVGQVSISVKELSDGVEFSIQDTGIGISQENLRDLFEGGRHVNLSIARGIIEKHRGKIWIESEPGKTTKVTFKLPKLQK